MANFRIYNETLCPELWDSAQHLDPRIRVNLLRMAYDFYEKTNLPAPIVDVYLMGSIANYNWTADSDVDVHVIINYKQLQMPDETANKTVKTAGAQWNAEHNVLIKGHKVEMNLQNAKEEKPYVTGIYSLIKDQWVRHPVKVLPQIDRSVIKVQQKSMEAYILNALRSGDREQMKAAKKYLDAYRQYGLDTVGELSYENIIFKILRAKGIIKQLKDSITAVYDREMSVDEVGERDIKQVLPNLAPGDAPENPELGDPKFDRSLWDKQDYKGGDYHIDRLTMDELKALRQKAFRFAIAYEDKGKPQWAALHKAEFEKYDAELKRRLDYINKPVTESTAPLKIIDPDDFQGKYKGREDRRIPAVMHIPTKTVITGKCHGTAFEWAQENGLPKENGVWDQTTATVGAYLFGYLFPSDGKFYSYPEIEKMDIEDMRRQMNLTECGVGSGIPEDDRLKIKNTDGSTRRWQIRSKDAPKTPKMTDTPPKAIEKFDKPVAV